MRTSMSAPRRRPVRAPLAGILLTLAALAGCGSSSSGNGVAAKSASQILASAEAVAEAASAVRVSGSIVSDGTPVTFDLHLVAGRGGRGQLAQGGLGFELVELGPNVFLKGSTAFYHRIGGSAAAQLFDGKWLKAPSSDPEFAPLASLTNLRGLVEKTLGSHGRLTKGSLTTLSGRKAIAVTDATKGGTLYVATEGPPYPIAIVQRGASGGRITFASWNQPVTILAPSGAIDISQLQTTG
jgi:hypothetical protein